MGEGAMIAVLARVAAARRCSLRRSRSPLLLGLVWGARFRAQSCRMLHWRHVLGLNLAHVLKLLD